MSCRLEPIPAAAQAAGLTRLTFCEDFEKDTAIDFSGKGLPGYSFYCCRDEVNQLLRPTMAEVHNSVLRLRPTSTVQPQRICTYSEDSHRGFVVHFGYIEARIRANNPIGRHRFWPKFWCAGIGTVEPSPHTRSAEIVVMELTDPLTKGRNRSRGKDMIYAGVLHDCLWEQDDRGEWYLRLCTNSVNSTGYNDEFTYVDNDWHTYGVLWEPGYVAWYMDNVLMHAARFVGDELPQYYYRDDPRPLPRIEDIRPDWRKQPWEGAHTITDRETMALSLLCHPYWTMDVDWVRVWE